MAIAIIAVLTMALGAMVASTTALQIQTRNRLDTLADRQGDTTLQLGRLEIRIGALEERVGALEVRVGALENSFERHLRTSA